MGRDMKLFSIEPNEIKSKPFVLYSWSVMPNTFIFKPLGCDTLNSFEMHDLKKSIKRMFAFKTLCVYSVFV